ncbi:MAG TPA: superoxide dismutase [Phycisphaerales bacterium]|nr:superoxide dismutase [Phycisphaerales bacterium]
MPFTLPELPYAENALEPWIDAQTMSIHRTKHHQAYVTNANNALAGSALADASADEVCRRLKEAPADKLGVVRNNAGGHFNHSLFWQLMAPPGKGGGGAPTGDLAGAINAAFGSFDGFKEKFAGAAAGRFGSGWAWLCAHAGGKVEICSTANQDNPLMKPAIGDAAGCGGAPVLGLDVWEHAYYLKYQNKRPDYVAAWWNVVNWSKASELYAKAK